MDYAIVHGIELSSRKSDLEIALLLWFDINNFLKNVMVT